MTSVEWLGFTIEDCKIYQSAAKIEELVAAADQFARLKTVGAYLELVGVLNFMC